MDEMSLDSRRRRPGVIAIVGDLDTAGAPELVAAADTALVVPGVSGTAVDMSMVRFVDCAGITALVMINNAAAAGSKTLVVLKPSARTRQVLSMTGIDSVRTINPDCSQDR